MISNTQTYLGTKQVRGTPMTRLAYNCLRGWDIPINENPADEGYLVEYLDGGKPNHPDYAGYISWLLKAQFEAAYRTTTDGMTFGLAIEALKLGKCVARAGWFDTGIWLNLAHVRIYDVGCSPVGKEPDEPPRIDLLPWIGMKTADNKFVPWFASQTDMLAEDWYIVGSC